jgi:thiol-disulfide isomerase/thioredoxin
MFTTPLTTLTKILLGGLLILLGFTLTRATVAQQISNLSFNNLSGQKVVWAEAFSGRVIIAAFSAQGLPLTDVELPQLERLAARYQSSPVTILWISTNSTRPKASNYVSLEDLQALAKRYPHVEFLTVVQDNAYRQSGIDTLPTFFILDQQGKLTGKPRIGIDPQTNLINDLSPLINQLLAKP